MSAISPYINNVGKVIKCCLRLDLSVSYSTLSYKVLCRIKVKLQNKILIIYVNFIVKKTKKQKTFAYAEMHH